MAFSPGGFAPVRYMMAFYSVAASFRVDAVVGEDGLRPTVGKYRHFYRFSCARAWFVPF